ncbi:MAG: hypothetical protein QME81_07155 [bacterium]|nr:hypothetical protein [bacterium]
MWRKNRIEKAVKVLIPIFLLAVLVGFLGIKWSEISTIIDEMAVSKIVKKPTSIEPETREIETGEIRRGFLNGDTIPTRGSLGNWNYTGGFAFDCYSRSIGLDLGRLTSIKGIKLISSSANPTRLSKKDISIYYSRDNQGFIEYTQDYRYQDILTDPEHKGVRVIVLSDLDITGRYIKVYQKYNDSKFTFVNSALDKMIKPLYDDYPLQAGSKTISFPTNITRVQPKQIKDVAGEKSSPPQKAAQPEKAAESKEGVKPKEAAQPQKAAASPQKAAPPNIKKTGIKVGYCDQDAEPMNQPIGHWDYEGGFAFDYGLRSIGIDLGAEEKGVRQIKLIGWNANPTRLKESDISIYLSQDNRRFIKYTGTCYFTDTLETGLVKKVRVLTLSNLSCQARYVKIHQPYRDADFTFANHLPKMVEIDFLSGAMETGKIEPAKIEPAELFSNETKIGIKVGYCDQDINPVKQPIGHWGYEGGFAFDYGLRSIGLDLGKEGKIKKIKLMAWNDNETRLKKADLTIYLSQDNLNFSPYPGDWRLVERVEPLAEKKVRILILEELFCQARFIKIHQGYANAEYTFANNLLQMLEVEAILPEIAEKLPK